MSGEMKSVIVVGELFCFLLWAGKSERNLYHMETFSAIYLGGFSSKCEPLQAFIVAGMTCTFLLPFPPLYWARAQSFFHM